MKGSEEKDIEINNSEGEYSEVKDNEVKNVIVKDWEENYKGTLNEVDNVSVIKF